MMLFDVLRMHHGVAHVRTLQDAGVPDTVIRAARRGGAVWQPRRSWIAAPDADEWVVAAVAAGGRLGCATQAARLGMWMLDPPGLHLSLPRHSGHAHPPDGATAHWRGRAWHRGFATHDPIETVVRDLADCLAWEASICALDSALNARLIGQRSLERSLADTRRGGRMLPHLDGRAESGLESLVRLRLAAAGIRSTPQHVVPGVGRVDLIVGERLLIECDGRQHHDDPEARARDRARDLLLAARGYFVLRLDVAQILSDWLATLAVVRALIARGEHRWREAHRRQGLTGG